MSDQTEDKPLVSKTGLVVDFLLSIVFFGFMFWVLMPRLPTDYYRLYCGWDDFFLHDGCVLDLGQYVPRHLGRLPKEETKTTRPILPLSKGREIL